MSNALSTRIARLEGGASVLDRYFARLSDEELEAIVDTIDKCLAGQCRTRDEWLAALGPALLAKAETLFRLWKGEEPKYTADLRKEP